MKKEILNTIIERVDEVNQSKVLKDIRKRAIKKFHGVDGIFLYELKDYIIAQMRWKKQNLYYHLLPLLYQSCGDNGQVFEFLFDNPENYRDAVYELI